MRRLILALVTVGAVLAIVTVPNSPGSTQSVPIATHAALGVQSSPTTAGQHHLSVDEQVSIAQEHDAELAAQQAAAQAAALAAQKAHQAALLAQQQAQQAQAKKVVSTTTTTAPHRTASTTSGPVTAPTSGDFASVRACIKSYESGNYTEHSHISTGSGAYQLIPSTWRSWSARAGYGGYTYAYLAPPSVQDAVVIYMLGNGGQHNWDPAYGNDPCTRGMR